MQQKPCCMGSTAGWGWDRAWSLSDPRSLSWRCPACVCPYVYIPVQMKQKHFPPPFFFFFKKNCIKAESCTHVGLTSALLVSLTLRETSAWGGWLAGSCSLFPGELSFSSCYQKISWQTQTWRLAAPDQSCKRVILQMFWHVFVCVYIYKFIYKKIWRKRTPLNYFFWKY